MGWGGKKEGRKEASKLMMGVHVTEHHLSSAAQENKTFFSGEPADLAAAQTFQISKSDSHNFRQAVSDGMTRSRPI